jgi:hypothetical protein
VTTGMALPTDDQLRAFAREILAQEKYARWRHEEVAMSWMQWLLHERLRLQTWLSDLAARSPLLFAALFTVLGLIAAALLFHAGWTIRQSMRAEPARAPDLPSPPPPAEAAARLAAGGHFLDAARLLQIAVLEHLVSRRLVTLSPAESNAVLTARLERASLPGDLAGRAVALVRGLERRWFRDRAEDATLYDAWRRLHGDLVTEVP